MKKNIKLKRAVLLMIVSMIVISFGTALVRKGTEYINGRIVEQSVATHYDTITDYQRARWTEIQAEIFGSGVASNETDSNLLNASVRAGNKYFNWTNSGVTPWNGGSSTVSRSSTETKNYSTVVNNGATVSKTITYDVYNVYSAEELYYVMTTFASNGSNIKVNILRDLDMNGMQNKVWNEIGMSGSGWFYIEGNGHTIYNLNAARGFTGYVDRPFITKNLNFKSFKIVYNGNDVGLFRGTSNFYIKNVHAKEGFIQANGGGVAAITGGIGGNNIFIEDSSSEKCYIYGNGNHIGGFMGISGGSSGVKYNSSIPQVPEAVFGSANLNLNQSDSAYHIIVEDCYSIDSEIFATSGHSGCFISCTDGGITAKRCFTNNTIYGEADVGGIIGSHEASNEWGKYSYGDDGQCNVNGYYEDCYSSGIIEGKMNIGGFIGKTNAVIFKNCYSTASVGMDYSGSRLGGFNGYQHTGIHANKINDYSSSTVTGPVYINCYAAGEVGDVITDTNLDTAETKGVGGFIGLANVSSQCNVKNCYYDMQTTGMREVAIGSPGNNGTCQISGLTGVYTKASQIKGVKGLTTTTGSYAALMGDDKWTYNEGKYPQLKVFANSADEKIRNYSEASTATVFLNHYDETLDTNGNIISSTDKTSYDTVRDITSTFEFTSKGNSEIQNANVSWMVDEDKNNSKGYIQELKIKDGSNLIKTVPVLTIANAQVNSREISGNEDIYKCYSFAPGKSWVKVEIGSGENVGVRRIRLLPTAYLEAGDITEVAVKTNEDNTIQNNIIVNGTTKENAKLSHEEDTIYAITSKENLADNKVIYPGQITSKSRSELNLFALWNNYPKSSSTGAFDNMYSQSLIGTSNPNGATKVEVYKLNVIYNEENKGDLSVDNSTVYIPQIDYENSARITGANLDADKWNGKKNFEVSDEGWYELKYYWRLNDGRYLSDSKIVIIDGVDSKITKTANIIKGKEDYNAGNLNVSADIKQNVTNISDLDLTTDNDSTKGISTTLNNETVVKSMNMNNFHSSNAIVGFGRNDNYKFEELGLEISTDGENWNEIPLQVENGYSTTYSYLHQTTELNQYEDTKEYYVVESETVPVTLTAEVIIDGYNGYVKLNYTSDDNTKIYNSNVRVKSSYIPISDIEVNKIWEDLTEDKRPESIILKVTDSNSNEFEKEVTKDDEWKYLLEDMPTADLESNDITYTVDEKEVNSEDLKCYTKKIEGYNITNSIITYDITTKVNGVGGTISGDENVVYTDNSVNDVVVNANYGYKIKSIKVNYPDGTSNNLSITNSKTMTLEKFENVSSDIEVVAEFEKLKSKVTIKYLDAITSEEISTIDEMTDYVDEEYTTSSKTISGYALSETPANANGVYTEDEIIVTYKYLKISNLTIKHMDFNTNNELITAVKTQLKEGDTYNTSSREISEYTLVSTPENANGTMGHSDIEVVYYYKKNSGVTVKYIDKYQTDLEVADSVNITGLEGDDYTTTKKDVSGYVYDSVDGEVSGKLQSTATTVTYYYIKQSNVVTKYIDENTGAEISGVDEITITYKEKDAYTTEKKTIDGYTYTRDTENTSGTVGREDIEVIYYYKKNSGVTVKYIDENTGAEIPGVDSITTTYKEGDTYTTEKKTIDGYTYTRDTENTNGIVGRENIEVIYYYKKNSGVTVKYIDKYQTDLEVADSVSITGLEGDNYTTTKKDVSGYVYDSVDGEVSGNIGATATTVIYYYIKQSNVVTKYIDENTGKKVSEEITTTYKEKDAYTTEKKTIDGYTYTRDTSNTTGTVGRENIEVIYYYKKNSGVIVKYIDKYQTDLEVADSVSITGLEGDDYTTTKKDVSGYAYDSVVGEVSGKLQAAVTTVTYNYVKESNVTTKYINELTGEEIHDEKVVKYKQNDVYSTSSEEIAGYTLVKTPDNKNGIVQREDITVTYEYRKISQGVEIQYIDQANGNKISSSIVKNGVEGTEYTSEAKDISGYELVKTPENANGEMTVDKIVVKYEYRLISYVTVNYEDEVTRMPLKAPVSTKYLEGQNYTSTQETFEGYTFSRVEGTPNGTMGRKNLVITYYYKKNTNVIVKYVDMLDGNREIHDAKTIPGVEGQAYTTEPIEISGYEYIRSAGRTSGNMTTDTITVIYKYKKLATLTTTHIDIDNGQEIHEPVVTTYKEGDTYEALPQNIAGYVKIEEPEEKTGVIGREDITRTYKYRKISEGLVVKYVDVKTNDVLDEVVYDGNVGDVITLDRKSFMYYLLYSKPDFDTVTLTDKHQEVIYYYVRSIKMDVIGVDEETGKELFRTKIEGPEGDPYDEEDKKDLDGYELVEMPANAKGFFDRRDTEIKFVYRKLEQKVETSVVAKYIDRDTGKELDSATIIGYVGDSYRTDRKEFEGYELVKIEGNEYGKMEEEQKVVKYIYARKSGKVIVTYEDEEGNVIDSEELTGKVGEDYEVKIKEIEGYEVVEIPDNVKGKYTEDIIEVKVKVQKIQVAPAEKGTIIVKFVDSQGNAIKEKIVQTGDVGEKFYFEAPQIDGYKIVLNSNIKAEYTNEEQVFDVIYEKISVEKPEEPKEEEKDVETGDINVLVLTVILGLSIIGIKRKFSLK